MLGICPRTFRRWAGRYQEFGIDGLRDMRLSGLSHRAAPADEVMLTRIVGRIRKRWPKVRVVVRGDSGFCREPIMRWCECNDVDYVLGLARNERLVGRIEKALRKSHSRHRGVSSGWLPWRGPNRSVWTDFGRDGCMIGSLISVARPQVCPNFRSRRGKDRVTASVADDTGQ